MTTSDPAALAASPVLNEVPSEAREGAVIRVVGINEGRPAWADAAFDVLREVARTYNDTIAYSDLAERVEARTGLTTRVSQRNWIGKVLSDVVQRCHDEGLPALTALVVHKGDGEVGEGYGEVLRVAGLPSIDDKLARERHAAVARLDCYRHFGARLPADARPTLSVALEKRAAREVKARPPRRGEPCPTCFVETPLSGRCINCHG